MKKLTREQFPAPIDVTEVEVCKECGEEREVRVIDVDGTNLEEQLICPYCEEY